MFSLCLFRPISSALACPFPFRPLASLTRCIPRMIPPMIDRGALEDGKSSRGGPHRTVPAAHADADRAHPPLPLHARPQKGYVCTSRCTSTEIVDEKALLVHVLVHPNLPSTVAMRTDGKAGARMHQEITHVQDSSARQHVKWRAFDSCRCGRAGRSRCTRTCWTGTETRADKLGLTGTN